MGIIAGLSLAVLLFAFVFWPERNPFYEADKTRADYLHERKEVIYDNLRDLNFEYQAGKYPEPDYIEQRTALENEAATVIGEIETLERRSTSPARGRA
jgi:hypothetical protein